jgi:chemotaxis protein MotB
VRYGATQETYDDQRSEQGSEERSRLTGIGTEVKPPSPAGADSSEAKVRMVPGADGMRIDLDDLAEQLEYDSGEVKVKAPGLVVLEKIADFLRTAAAEKAIRVEGHADNMEIGPSLKSAFPSNWELSRARAAGIVRYLVEKGGLDSAKLSAVGYGASRPVASNATEEGRKRNRRIEIVLLATETSRPAQDMSQRPGGSHQKDSHDGQAVTDPLASINGIQAAGPPTNPTSSTAGSVQDQPVATPPAPEAQRSPADVVGDQSAPAPLQ